MNKPIFKIVDYVQSSDASQDTSGEPEVVQTKTHSYDQRSLTQNSESGYLAVSTFKGPTPGTTQSTEMQRDDQRLSPLQLTSQTDFKKMGQPRQKTIFTVQQLTFLLNFYERCQYINADEVTTLANKTGLTIKQVRHWFTNRRAASKRKNSSID